MRTKIIHITDKNINQVSYDLFKRFTSMETMGNNDKRNRMKEVLHKAIYNELTDKQRMCLLLHYYEGMKMKDIALKLGLQNSTVSRHIASATKKLKNIAQYYM